jgi:type IV secretory pathway VirB2 component (pilin)
VAVHALETPLAQVRQSVQGGAPLALKEVPAMQALVAGLRPIVAGKAQFEQPGQSVVGTIWLFSSTVPLA